MNKLDDKSPQKSPMRELHLSLALQRVLNETIATEEHAGKPLTLALIIDATGERAFGVLMAFLCLPFLTPIPLPGLSIPFGIALLILGAQLAIRKHHPWLPAWMLARRLPPKFGPKLILFVTKIFRPLEKIVKPRLAFMQNAPAMVAVGIALMVDGFILSLPLPPVIPLSNALPAWMALIKILGLTEGDGISLLTGTILSFALAAAVIVLIVMGAGKFSAWW